MYRVNSRMKSEWICDLQFAKLQKCSKVICCDASDTGYGFRVMCDGNVRSVALWDERDI